MNQKNTELGKALVELENIRICKKRQIHELADGYPCIIPTLHRMTMVPSLQRLSKLGIVNKLNKIMRGYATACSRALIQTLEKAEDQVILEVEKSTANAHLGRNLTIGGGNNGEGTFKKILILV